MDKEKIRAYVKEINGWAHNIRGDWSDPRWECRQIWDRCEKINKLLDES